uniref:Uncharacterized protein n=1 Tax=Lactuca sativa TaxID=4236 RepID=A0A9R1VAX5_LACSA|nr:hypothetical protein LSAT_V11C600324350 [Lactuca sativa]
MEKWKVIATGGFVFEKMYRCASYKVDLEAHYCTCVHGQAAELKSDNNWRHTITHVCMIKQQQNYIHMNPTDFLSIWFQKEKFVVAYTTNISSVDSSNMLVPTAYIKTLPPLIRRMSGRPKTKRRRHVSNVNDSKFPTIRARDDVQATDHVNVQASIDIQANCEKVEAASNVQPSVDDVQESNDDVQEVVQEDDHY